MRFHILPFMALALIGASAAQAQTVQWASEVIRFSSQYSDSASSAQQILGRPNVLPATGDSRMAWAVETRNDEGHESIDEASITVGFANPMSIRRVAIGESCGPGAIQRVELIDVAGKRYRVYDETPAEIEAKGRMLNISVPKTPYRVAAVAITMQPGLVAGWNELDAVAISDGDEPIEAKVNVVPNLRFPGRPEHLGDGVNSEVSDLVDGISPDGRTLYLSRDGHPGNIGGVEGGRDVWYSTLQRDGSWGEAVNIGRPINNESINFVNSVTPDGNSLLLGNRYDSEGELDGPGVSLTHRTARGWSIPENVEIEDYENLGNSATFCMSPDGRTILLSVRREDSHGENDLYASFLKRNGRWTKPKNLGSMINTIGNEIGPMLAADGTTLYYSSNGLTGYGSNDIYLSRRLDDTWTNWSEPQNLGPAINTSEFEAYYVIPAEGDYAYYSSAKDSKGSTDIFRIALPKEIRPNAVVLVRGKVFDAKTRQPIGATIRYEILPGGADAGEARSNPADGEYRIALPSGSNFGFRAEAPGFYAASENLNTSGLKDYLEIEKDLYLAPIEVGQTIRLNNIFFETGSAALRSESYPELDRVVELLTTSSSMRIALNGHTDNVGGDAANMTLSSNRAKAVAAYLESKGIAASRLSSKGYGETKPLTTNDTDEGRQLNRRVEFTIVAQ